MVVQPLEPMSKPAGVFARGWAVFKRESARAWMLYVESCQLQAEAQIAAANMRLFRRG